MNANLPSGWSVIRLRDCGQWYSGGTPHTSVPDYWGGDIPWITASSLKSFYLSNSERRISEAGLHAGSRLVPVGAILFVVRGMSLKSEFRVGIATRPLVFGQDCKAIVANRGIEPLFLANVLRARAGEILALSDEASHGTGRLQTEALEQLQVALPPLHEQRGIAHILGTLDDKIELNRRMNETLETIARALFKSWFVDFDPVRAKSEGHDPGLPKHLAELFPDSFEESELGEIPKGWQVCPLDGVATYLNGLALQKYPPGEGDSLPVIKIAQLRAGHTAGADRASADIPAPYIVEDGDVLFSWSGSLEVEVWCGGRGALNQHVFKVTSERFPKWFYLLWTRRHLPDFRSIAAGKATTMGHIQRSHLTAAKALVPPAPLLDAMNGYFAPLLENLIAGRLQSRTVAALRDTLLPKLISGELRVRDAERLVAV